MTTETRLRRTSLSDEAYTVLREMLLGGARFAPGDKISVEELSRELGVSRSPVWGAIARLEAEGIVEVIPRQGVYLIRFDPATMVEIYQVREALEGMAARLAAAHASPRQVEELAELVARQRDSLARQDRTGYAAATLTFHRDAVRLSGNDILERTLGGIYARSQALCGRLQLPWSEIARNCDDHAALVAALRDRDTDRAEAAARAHARRLCAAVLAAAAAVFPGKAAR